MKVLAIEDDRRIAYLVEQALLDAGHVVTVANNGLDGYKLAEQETFDVIVLDVMLPGMHGFDICRRLRRQRRRTPILMLTARDAVSDRVQGLDAGADDYLVKPFAIDELLARLRALVRRTDGDEQGEVLRLADLTLDTRSHEAKRNGQLLALTVKEFQLLEYFLRHPGRVLTREQITDQVWGYDADISSNVLETYIHYLRDKVDRGFGRALIRTVRGVGYMLAE